MLSISPTTHAPPMNMLNAVLATLLAALLIAPIPALACIADGEAQLHQNIRYYPIVGDTTEHWPSQAQAQIGSITSFLLPIDATVELKHIEQGALPPLTLFGEASHEQMRVSRDVVPRWRDIPYDAKKFRWVHIYASSFGVSEVRMSAPSGWAKTIKLTLGYPSPTEQALRAPIALTLGQGEMQTATVDAYDNIEVTLPGSAADGWTATPVADTGFELIRIEQVQKVSGKPEVKLFFAGTRNPRSATVTVKQGSGFSAKTIRFKIQAVPTPAC
ncbi:MAG TPA: hypothetical protein VLC08_04015 [Chitinolyticbacter sp.]|nr:hypothetical protein [Chitinolyticbacter sp.]